MQKENREVEHGACPVGTCRKNKTPKIPCGTAKSSLIAQADGAVGGRPVPGSSRAQQQRLVLPHSLSRKDGKGRAPPQGWIWEKRLGRRNPNGAASPLAFPRVGLASSLADLPAFCRRAGAQQPPGLSRRRSSCGAAPVCPDNGRVLGGFRCLTSYKMFVNQIYPVARR